MRTQFLAPLLPSLVGVALGATAYLEPFGNTGVGGTVGALLALIGAVATALGIVLLSLSVLGHRLSIALTVLVFLGAGLTALAAYFLMQGAFAIAMAATIAGMVFALVYRPRRRIA